MQLNSAALPLSITKTNQTTKKYKPACERSANDNEQLASNAAACKAA